MVARLVPSAGRTTTAKVSASSRSDVVCLTLGLPHPGGDPVPAEGTLGWPTQQAIAARLGITQTTVSRHQQSAIREWAGAPWLESVRDEVVGLVAAAGRVMTVDELAATVRMRHGAGVQTHHGAGSAESPQWVMAQARAVVRAAVEAETWPEPGEPRVAVRRRGQQVLIALESLPGTDDASAPELADYALALGRRAEELAVLDPLPGHATVVRELRAVPAPEGLAPLADTRLVALAAAVSHEVAASPRLELYPRTLDLTRALRISQAAAGVRRDGISLAELLNRVRARFPELALDDRLTHVQAEEALKAAGFSLEYDISSQRFRPPAPDVAARPATSSSTLLSAHERMAAAGLDPNAVIADKLAAKVERGGFLALPLRGNNLPGAAQALAAHHSVLPVDLNHEFLSALRAVAAEHSTDWHKILRSDARFSETGQMSGGLASYSRTTWARVEQRLLELAAEPKTVLFVHNAGLLARYHDAGGHRVLTRLQAAARRPSEVPHGFWLLCPMEAVLDTPNIDGRIVEVLDDSERVVLTKKFLAALHDEPSTAA